MDWGSVSKRLYPIAVEGVVVIGKYLAESMNYMHKEGLIDLKKTRLVGHSLGAHLIGIAGYHTVIKPLYIIGKFCDLKKNYAFLVIFYTQGTT